MDSSQRIEQALQDAVSRAGGQACPPQLAAALRDAVFPGGARVRPRLCLAVARACGDPIPAVANAAAASIELLHCASLVHDDLPCFDDADTRRGKPSVHKSFGEPLAVLTGDALIVLAFQTLALGAIDAPDRLAGLIDVVSRAVGGPSGIVAGQAWECEASVSLSDYHRAKTGSLFAAATIAGAVAAGGEPEPWRRLGECLGEAFQVADDICDLTADPFSAANPASRTRRMRGRTPPRRSGSTAPGGGSKLCSRKRRSRFRPVRARASSAWRSRSNRSRFCLRGSRSAPPDRRPARRPVNWPIALRLLPMPIVRSGRLAMLRDRLLLNPRFLSLAAAFPLTRMIARRRAPRCSISAPASSIRRSCSLASSSGCSSCCATGPLDRAVLARRLGLEGEAATRLLDAAIALAPGGAARRERYGLGPLGAAVAGNPGIAAMVEHHAHLYADLADPVALLKGERPTTALGDYWPYAGANDPAALGPEQVAPYSA